VVKLFCKGDVASRVLAARTAPDVMTPMQGASMSQSPAAGLDLHAQALERAQQSAPPEVIAGLLGMLQNHPQVCKGLLQEFPLEPELMPVLMDTLLENIAQRFESFFARRVPGYVSAPLLGPPAAAAALAVAWPSPSDTADASPATGQHGAKHRRSTV